MKLDCGCTEHDIVRRWLADHGLVAVDRDLMNELAHEDKRKRIVYAVTSDTYRRYE
jgi:hypothetical protein